MARAAAPLLGWVAFAGAVLAAFAAAGPAAAAVVNNRPVWGILTVPCDGSCTSPNQTAYFPASYVKWLEGAGAQVVPIQFDAPASEVLSLLGQLNGVLFTGGGASLAAGAPYLQAAQLIYGQVAKFNAAGDYFPLWGTCMGFEAVVVSQANDPSVLQVGFDSENLTLALDATELAASSLMFDPSRPGAQAALRVMTTEPVTMNNHQAGIEPTVFRANQLLDSFFNVLATNEDRSGLPFVSLIEGKSGYVFASQFHPEKVQYEWYPDEVIQHTADAVSSMQYLAQFAVDMSRSSGHSFSSPEALSAALIYNYAPVFTNGEFTQVYVW